MTGLLLVAAALTPAQRRAEFGGDHDLDEGGRRAAAALAAGRPGRTLDRRAVESGPADRRRPRRHPRHRPGTRRRRTTATGPAAPSTRSTSHAWLTDPGFAPPGGESLTAVRDRAGAWLDAQAGRTLVAVAHATVVRAALAHALDLPADGIWRLDVAPLAALRLTHRAGRWHLRLAPPAPTR